MTADEIGRILDELGDRLGPAGSHVFELAVRQQIVTGALWTVVLLVAAVTAALVAVGAVRRVRRLETTISDIDRQIDAAREKYAVTAEGVRQFRDEKEKAELDAMTPKARAAWYEQMVGVLNFSSYGYGSPTISADLYKLRDANGNRLFVAGIAGLTAAVCLVFAFLGPVPAVLNPEYAAIRDLIGAIR